MNQQLDLPEAVAAYFAPDLHEGAAISRCFCEDAVVTDEGKTHTGVEAIRRWRADVAAQYSFTSEPLSQSATGDAIVVKSRVTGNFPGSPVELRYRFRLDRGKIATLDIMR